MHLVAWKPTPDNNFVVLVYAPTEEPAHIENTVTLFVRMDDWNRAFGTIVSAPMDTVAKEYAVR